MNLGERLGPYEVTSLLGKGGMGEVYRAVDTRVGREVAVKISGERFSERFEREARAIAALNQPNICTLYDVGPNYLVMELVEGESPQGPLPLDEVLRIARQIAAALQEAHSKNIVHRDLKPGNIRIKPDGTVKVLDFGLAKIGGTPAAASHDSPTMSLAATQAGVILGTAAYMSPEQARGKEADKRSDIWAFGVVLYELLTGKRLFDGDTISDVLAAVLRHEADFSLLPEPARKLVQRCLEKDPKRRLQDAGDMELLLEQGEIKVAEGAARSRKWLWPAVAALFAVAAIIVSAIHFREQPPKLELSRFEIAPPEKTNFVGSHAISPDGRTLAFAAAGADGTGRLWVRPLDSLEARALRGTDGAQNPVFWSPDSRKLAFSGSALGVLKTIEVAGGPAQTLCPARDAAPLGAWSSTGTIVYKTGGGLWQVPAAGGECTVLTTVDSQRGEVRHSALSFLPDGRHFLYLRVAAKLEDSGVYVGSLDSKPEAQSKQRLITGFSPATYAPVPGSSTGHLLFLRDGTLMAQGFDPRSYALTGDAQPIAEDVGTSNQGDWMLSAVSTTGTLVYRSSVRTGGNRLMTWYDRSGKPLSGVAESGNYSQVVVSPDGKRVAFDATDSSSGNRDIWIHNLSPGTTDRFTFDPASDFAPVWSSDGSRIFFSSPREGNLFQRATDLTGGEQPLLKTPDRKFPQDVSADGRFLLYASFPAGASDLWVLPLQGGTSGGDAKPRPLLQTPFTEGQARFSPDGRFIVYSSDETGRFEVYVRPFSPDGSAAGGQQMISQGGGTQPLWARGGKEIFYISPDSRVMAVPVTTGPTFQRGTPVPLFTAPIYGGGNVGNQNHRWDVTADGKKFLITSVQTTNSAQPITVILNWPELLKR